MHSPSVSNRFASTTTKNKQEQVISNANPNIVESFVANVEGNVLRNQVRGAAIA